MMDPKDAAWGMSHLCDLGFNKHHRKKIKNIHIYKVGDSRT